MPQSPELAGGAGHTFEDVVSAQYLTALLCEGNAPGIADRTVLRVALQQRDFDAPLDDLIVDFASPEGNEARLSLQLKRALTISSAKTNKDFREIVRDSWRALQQPDFRDGIDRFGGATGSVAVNASRTLETLCEIARASPTVADFEARFTAGGNASAAQNTMKLDVARLIEAEIRRPCLPAEIHRFLAHFVLLKFDYLHAGAADPPNAINALRGALVVEQAERASLLWDRLCRMARDGAGRSEQFDRVRLVRALSPVARLVGSKSFRHDLDKVEAIARSWILDVEDDVGGTQLERLHLASLVNKALAEHRFVQIHGLPGSGKSVLMRRRVEADLAIGPVLFLKSDRLQGNSWAAFAVAHGLDHSSLEALLVELGAAGSKTLYIDGIDRIEKQHRAIIIDVLREILTSPQLDDWKILVTLRDSGIEPLRNWLPSALSADNGIGMVAVQQLDDTEAEILAEANAALRPLLFGTDAVREIVRRPFFAKILSQNFHVSSGDSAFAPRSEVDLIENWWLRGGYDAEDAIAGRRQRALLALGAYRVRHLSDPIMLSAMDASVIDLIPSLRADGILQDVRPGHSIRFAHDIFFEWAFFHQLIDRGSEWLDELRASGEPPVIARVIELLSQAEFARSDDWATMLKQIEASSLRSQWTRAWLLGPLTSPNFDEFEERFMGTVKQDGCRFLQKALVWFQAERTAPNPLILDGTSTTTSLGHDERIRAADLLGWPSDFATWGRFLSYLLVDLPNLPIALAPDILAVFEVWQNALADHKNPVSRSILVQTDAWLRDAEKWRDHDRKPQPDEISPWKGLTSDLKDFEQALRRLLLRAARAAPDLIQSYLSDLGARKRYLDRVFPEIIAWSGILAETHPALLADLTLIHLKEELPDEQVAREKEEARTASERRKEALAKPVEGRTRHDELVISHAFSRLGSSGFSHTDWEGLAVDRDVHSYFPASPLREPFNGLFAKAPVEALRLVRELSNHAMTAWRQLYHLDSERRATPIPLELEFPWGTQQFWGGRREYLWSRGIWAPKPLCCAYLALEDWVFAEIERGRDADELIEQIVTGNDCIAILGTAMSVAVETQRVSDTVQPLVTAQRLWRADIERIAQQVSLEMSSLIGFKKGDERHAEAVTAINKRSIRHRDVRDLVTLYVLSSDEARADNTRSAILTFPDNLAFEVEEQRENPEAQARLASFARTMVEWAHAENFRLVHNPDDEAQPMVVHINPQAATPESQAQFAETRQMLSEHQLFRWAEASIEKGILSGELTLEAAIARAKALDDATLFERGRLAQDAGMRRGAVSGTAAVALTFRNDSTADDQDWARTVVGRARLTPEEKDGLWSSVGIIPWHPCIFAARGLAADLRAGEAAPSTARALLALVAHPLECVSLSALHSIFSLWGILPRLAWCGLSLGVGFCQVRRGTSDEGSSLYNPDHHAQERATAVGITADAFEQTTSWPDLLPPPPAWVLIGTAQVAELDDDDDPNDDDGDDEIGAPAERWRTPDDLWDSHFAGKIVALLPCEIILEDSDSRSRMLPYCSTLLAWTIDKIAPSWDQSGRRAERHGSDIFEWRDMFMRFLGRLAGDLNVDTVRSSVLAPIVALGDDPCFSLLAPFMDTFVRAHVLDAPAIAGSADEILSATLDRLLLASVFDPDGYRAGQLSGWDVPSLVDTLLFVAVEHASGAARYVNGDWSDIARILPVVDRFVRAAGWSFSVINDYLKLCERASDTYPAELFADQVLELLNLGSARLSSWHGTLVQARIAGLVQFFTDREAPVPMPLAQKYLRILDALVDMGDRRSAALQISDAFRDVRCAPDSGFASAV